jgi:hypothetical protein
VRKNPTHTLTHLRTRALTYPHTHTLTHLNSFTAALTPDQKRQLATLKTPALIQAYLDDTPYSAEDCYRSPLSVVRDRQAHCFDGAVFAAAMLRRLGHPPLIVDLLPNARDDDHMLALFKIDGHLGALAKSNFSGLRYREPIFRTLRELVLSYFEDYFNSSGEKTLRAYTVSLNLARFDAQHWQTDDATMDRIASALDHIRKVQLITPRMEARLLPVDPLALKAGLLGSNPEGLFKL